MENIAKTFRCKPKISRLTPDEEIECNIEQLPPLIVLPDARIVDPDARSTAEIRAPPSVVLQEAAAKAAENVGGERVYVIRRRSEAHLSISEVEDEMLSLISNVILLEAEEVAKPI